MVLENKMPENHDLHDCDKCPKKHNCSIRNGSGSDEVFKNLERLIKLNEAASFRELLMLALMVMKAKKDSSKHELSIPIVMLTHMITLAMYGQAKYQNRTGEDKPEFQFGSMN